VVEVYQDEGISGDKRPGFDRMLQDASRRKFDVVMAWAIDRLGRSLVDLLDTIVHLQAVGADLYLDQQNIDTTTPAGKLLFQITGAFAEFERSMIRQRINAGLARARAQGKRLGRPRLAADKGGPGPAPFRPRSRNSRSCRSPATRCRARSPQATHRGCLSLRPRPADRASPGAPAQGTGFASFPPSCYRAPEQFPAPVRRAEAVRFVL
jgi:hypothetical protein